MSPVLADRAVALRRSSNSTRVRALAIATAAAMLVLVGIGASVLVGEGGVGPARRPSAGNGSAAGDDIPAPPNVRIVPPAKGLAPELAAFSGTWKGTWDAAQLPSRLTVEQVGRTSAYVVYAWGRSKDGTLAPSWQRVRAEVRVGPQLVFEEMVRRSGRCGAEGYPCAAYGFTFTMSPDRQTITGRREVQMTSGSYVNTVTMRRVGAQGRRIGFLPLALVAVAVVGGLGVVARRRFHR